MTKDRVIISTKGKQLNDLIWHSYLFVFLTVDSCTATYSLSPEKNHLIRVYSLVLYLAQQSLKPGRGGGGRKGGHIRTLREMQETRALQGSRINLQYNSA